MANKIETSDTSVIPALPSVEAAEPGLIDAMKSLINSEVAAIESAMSLHLSQSLEMLLSKFQSAKTEALRKATAQIRDEIAKLNK